MTNTNTKTTKREYFTALRALIADLETVGEIPAEEVVAFLDTQLAQLDAKNAKAKERAAEKKIAGDELRDAIKAVLTAKPQTVTDIIGQVDAEDLTPAKVVARLNQLVKVEEVVKEPIKIDSRRLMGYRLSK